MAAVAYGAKKQAEKRENKQPRCVFEKYDKDKSGKLDKDELLGAFADLGVHVKLKELDVYVKHYGKNDKVKFEAFDKLLTAMQELEDEKQADLEKICNEDMTLGFHFFRTLSSTLARRLRNTSDFVAHFKGMSQKRR